MRILARHNPFSEEFARQGRANTTQSLVDAGVQAVNADLKDRQSLDALVQGVDTVLTTASATRRGGEDTIYSVDLQGTLNLIDVAKTADVKRFIYTSAFSALEGHPVPLYHIKGTCETAIEKSGMKYTILSPSLFMEIWISMVVGKPLMAKQSITLIGRGDHHHNFVSEADVAAYAIAAWDNPLAINQWIRIGGPASNTWTQVVDAVSQAVGVSLPVQYLPLGSEVPLLPPVTSGLLNGMETFETFVDMTETSSAYGVRITKLDEYIRKTFVQ